MKKLALAFISVLAVTAFFGCTTYQQTPGLVLEQAPPKEKNINRIVTFSVVGKGTQPELAITKGQALLMAERAAITDGYRQFAEKLKGVYVESLTKAGMGVVDQDYINTHVRSVLRGVEVKEITHGEYGIAQAVMELRVNFTRYGMIWWPEGLSPDLGFYRTASN